MSESREQWPAAVGGEGRVRTWVIIREPGEVFVINNVCFVREEVPLL